ncbi:MAG: DUF438 domain-containing protein, partial [Thermoplasmata archaeon]
MGDTFDLNSRTTIKELTKRYPFLIDFLPTLSPAYEKLRNPVMRKTMGAVATMEKVAGMGELELDFLLASLAAEIERQTGERVLVQGSAAAPSAQPEAPPAAPAPLTPEERKAAMRSIIEEIHEGGDTEELKGRFAEVISDISPGELAEVEQSLIDDGLPEEEVKNLCSLHVEVFKEGLDKGEVPSMPGGHPVHTYMMENRAAENILSEIDGVTCDLGEPVDSAAFAVQRDALMGHLQTLSELDKHYLRKENQLFPMLEDHGITGPSQVMWATHDDIRAQLKDAIAVTGSGEAQASVESINAVSLAVKDMVYKEEHILYPMCLENFSEAEWSRVRHGEEEIGYAWIMPATGWEPQAPAEQAAPAGEGAGTVDLDIGRLTGEQVNLMLKHLPVDITYVDANDQVAYYSDSDHRIFPRSAGIIGRQVSKCHPPKSVHIVERIVEAFKSGERDMAEFWITVQGRFVHIRYFAIRDGAGKYQGTIEVSQDITEIKA